MMENLKEKETKRRFFRRTGLNRAQRSLDSRDIMMDSCSPIPSHSHSLENNSMLVSSGSASGNFGGGSGSGSGGSNSLDESVIGNGPGTPVGTPTGRIGEHQHRRFMAAPRRARSAERFDGMRVAFNSPGDDSHPRNFRSPQLIRTGGGASVTDLGRPGSGSQTPTMQMPSPPPPYSSAVLTDITGPPSYRQAVAAMTAAAQAQGKVATGVGTHPARNFAMTHRGTQSFDTSLGMPTGTGLRTASSVPAFNHPEEVICNCSKCQVLQRPSGEMGSYGEYNDAVYMESQAFLMHEIMSEGIAFCSVM